jgi:Bacterial cell division membrane protein
VVFMLFSYVFVNIAMVSGLIPVVGAPLPLISYGGTSMLTIFISFGLIMSASIHKQTSLEEKSYN